MTELGNRWRAEETKRYQQGESAAELVLLHREDGFNRKILYMWSRRAHRAIVCRREFALRCRLHVVSSRLDEARQSQHTLLEQVASLEAQRDAAQYTADDGHATIVTLTQQLEESLEKTTILEGEKSQLEEVVRASKAENERLEVQVAILQDEKTDLVSQFTTVKEVLEQAEARAAEAKVSEDGMKVEVEKQTEKIHEMEKHVADLLIDKEVLEKRVGAMASLSSSPRGKSWLGLTHVVRGGCSDS